MASPPIQPPGVVQPLSDVRRRLAFALVLSAAVGASLVFSVIQPILPALARHFGGGQTGELTAQLGMTLPSLGWLVGGAVAGRVLAKVGMRAMIVSGIALLALAGGAGGLTPEIFTFGVSRFLVGLAGAFMVTGAVTLLADIYDDKSRPKMIGYQKAMSSFAAIPIMLGVGGLAGALGWRAPFGLYVAFGVVAGLFALFAVPPQATRPPAVGGRSALAKATFRRLAPILALIVFLHVLPIMAATMLPFILAEHGVASPAEMSVILCSSALLMSLGAIASGYLQVRFGQWKVLCAGVLLAAAGYMVVGLAEGGYAIAAASGAAIFGCGLYFTQYLTLPLGRVAPEDRATAVGLSQAATYVGAFLTPLVLAPVRAQIGLSGTYLAVGLVAGVAVAAGVVLARVRRSPHVAPGSSVVR